MKEMTITLKIKVNEDSIPHPENYIKNRIEDTLSSIDEGIIDDFVISDGKN